MKHDSDKGFEPAPAIPEQIADYIQERIIQGRLSPGERIAEARITQALGVSRGSVREALRLLHARHLVEFEARRGARVAPFGPQDVDGLYDLQIVLLTLLVQQTAQRWDEADLPGFLDHLARITQAAQGDRPAELVELSYEFMRAVADVVGNPFLSDTLERLLPAFGRAHYRALAEGPGERLELAQFIDEILHAVLARDTASVTAIVSRYGEHQRRVVLATFELESDGKPRSHAQD